jgi:hypothetical protein
VTVLDPGFAVTSTPLKLKPKQSKSMKEAITLDFIASPREKYRTAFYSL